MTTLTAVAAGGTWGTAATWSPAQVPTAADDVVIPAGTGNITLAATASCRSLDCTGYTGTLAQGAFLLNIGTSTLNAGAFHFIFSSTMTYTASQALALVSNNAGQATIDPGGKTIPFMNVTGSGYFKFASAVTVGGVMQFSGGTIDTNGFAFTAVGISAISGTKTLSLGSSTVTITGGGSNAWNFSGGTTTLNAGTSSIVFNSTAAITMFPGGLTYNNVSFTTTTTSGWTLNGTGTFNNLTFAYQTLAASSVNITNNITVTGTFTWGGTTATARCLLKSAVQGSRVTITAAAVVAQYADAIDITGAGAASWNLSAITGLSGDGGNNSGITFTTPISQTLTITATTSWASASWPTRVPLIQDDVAIIKTVATAYTFSINVNAACHNIDFSGVTTTLTVTPSQSATIYGNFVGSSFITITGPLFFSGRSTVHTFNPNGTVAFQTVQFQSGNGTYQLASNVLGSTGTVTLMSGTLDLNGYTFNNSTGANTTFSGGSILFNGGTYTCQIFAISVDSNYTRAIDFTNGTLNLTANTATQVWNVPSVTGLTITNSISGKIAITTASTSTRSFNLTGTGPTLPLVDYTVAGSTGILYFNNNVSLYGLNFSDASNARTLQMQTGCTLTIADASRWNVRGTSGKLMTIQSSSAAAHSIVGPSGGTISSDYLSIINSHASGSTFYAGANSTDAGGNTGWLFSAAPSYSSFTQTATARIAVQGGITQTAIARIAVNRSLTQTAVARIAQTLLKTQPAIARIANTRTLSQTAIARIILGNYLTKTQTALARIAVNGTKTQTAIARIAVKPTKTQTALARIAVSNTLTQTAVARIVQSRVLTQSARARIAQTFAITQPAKARIAVTGTLNQYATARLVAKRSFTVTATASITNIAPGVGGTFETSVTTPAEWSLKVGAP